MKQNQLSLMRYAFLVAVLVQVVLVLMALLQTPAPPIYLIVRAAALLGYIVLFWLIISSVYVREMLKLFGRPFLKAHHGLAVVSWVLIVAHPLAFALFSADWRVLLPVFSPLRRFLQLAGRPALYLIALASVAAIVRKSAKKNWRYVHRLNLLAFELVFVHAWLIGTDLASTPIRILWGVMAVIVVVVGLRKAVRQK